MQHETRRKLSNVDAMLEDVPAQELVLSLTPTEVRAQAGGGGGAGRESERRGGIGNGSKAVLERSRARGWRHAQ